MELESSLVTRIRSGDRDALAEFVRRHEPMIRARFHEQFALRSRELFDTSDFFATVLRRVDALQVSNGPNSHGELPGEMLRRIMLDAAADYTRTLRAESTTVRGRRLYISPQGRVKMGELDSRDRSHEWDTVVANLGATDGQILRLRAEGAEHRIVANALGMSEPAVRMRWHRIVTKVRDILRRRSSGGDADIFHSRPKDGDAA
jgi:hypothetical protein